MAIMMTSTVLLFCFAMGFFTGWRSMSGVALVCWGIHLGWLTVAHTPLAFLGNVISLVVFSLLAVGELIGDKLPQIPNRTDIGPLIARMVFGGLCGWALATNGHAAVAAGVACGAVGAIVGAFAGFYARRAITRRGTGVPGDGSSSRGWRGVKDFPVALIEDIVAIAGGLWIVSRF